MTYEFIIKRLNQLSEVNNLILVGISNRIGKINHQRPTYDELGCYITVYNLNMSLNKPKT